MGGFGGIIWFLIIGAFFYWMLKKGGCGGGHSHGGGGGHDHGSTGHNNGDAEEHNHGESKALNSPDESVAIVQKNAEEGPKKKKGCH